MRTYGGQGVTKVGVNPSTHAIIHMRGSRASSLELEYGMTKQLIAVDPAYPGIHLDPVTRLNFSKVYTVEHTVKTMNIGRVTEESMPLFDGYWQTQSNPCWKRLSDSDILSKKGLQNAIS